VTSEGASPPADTARPLGRQQQGLNPIILIGAYVALGLAPLALALIQDLPTRHHWRELSSGLAMIGFAMMMVQFLLSGRTRPISGRIGIDLTMRFHQLVAWTILAFIVAHPLLLGIAPNRAGDVDFLGTLDRLFLQMESMRTGVIAWILLILLVLAAAFRDRLRIPYEMWRLTHGAAALAIAGLGAHHTLTVGVYYDESRWVGGFWLVLTAVAVASLAYVYILKPALKLRSPYAVVGNEKAADRMWRVTVRPRHGAVFDYRAGQFAWVNFGHASWSLTEHPFSISSAPTDRSQLEFTIKESGDFTNRIGTVSAGTRVFLDGPHGAFTLAGRGVTSAVFIAGGVGFAPILGLLRQLAAEGHRHKLHLIYGNRVETQILYRSEIETLKQSLDLKLDLVLSEPPPGWLGRKGDLGPDELAACLDPIDREAHYFVCGPVPMMDSVERTLRGLQVPAGRIISERFKYH
jgi:predicted ferric reductase